MEATAERCQMLDKARRVVVKVGSAVLTTPTGLAQDVIDGLAGQISDLMQRGLTVVLVSSGAVAAGRGVIQTMAREQGRDIKDMPGRQAASAIGQSRLMHAYDQSFSRRGVITAQILLTKDDFRNQRRFLNACNTFDTLFSWNVLPVVNENDSVVVAELVFGDNDCLSGLLLNLVEADLLVNLTSASAVYTANPEQDAEAKRLDTIQDIASLDLKTLCGGKTTVGSGGMYSKLLAARRSAQLGVPTLILPGAEPDILTRAFAGENLGTWVQARGKKISRRKFRLAYNTEPAGSVSVDAGAAKALAAGGKSLLPAGIVATEGTFASGELIRILTRDGTTLGVGLSNYSAEDIRRIAGKKCSEIEAILGHTCNEAIHRDNLLLDAALYD